MPALNLHGVPDGVDVRILPWKERDSWIASQTLVQYNDLSLAFLYQWVQSARRLSMQAVEAVCWLERRHVNHGFKHDRIDVPLASTFALCATHFSRGLKFVQFDLRTTNQFAQPSLAASVQLLLHAVEWGQAR